MDDIIYHVHIDGPPEKYIVNRKKPKLDAGGKIVKDAPIYLNANIFYEGVHWAVRNKIVDFAKDWIYWFLTKMPKMEKCAIEIIYHHPSDRFDLDNKVYFWAKIILDLMKTPTSAQIIKAAEYKRVIKSLEVLDDDTVRYIDDIHMKYKKGQPGIEIIIRGRKKQEQQSLF